MHLISEIANYIFSTDFGLHNVTKLMNGLSSLGNLVFFELIKDFLNEQIDNFGASLLGRTTKLVAAAGVTLMTIWIMIQGFRIVTGQSRDSMAALVTNSLRATFIVGLAGVWGAASSDIFELISDDLQQVITTTVTGEDENVYKNIDKSLTLMQVAFTSIDAVQAGSMSKVEDSKTQAKWFTGIGTGGPALTGGVLLLLNKIAMALFVGFGPIFIICLLFDQTKSLFQRWLLYGIGMMFSLAVLSVMVSIALDVVTAVALKFWASGLIFRGDGEGLSSMALQQGGLGLILTMLIISAPPIASSFFQGTLGQFYASSWFGSGAATAQANPRPGQPYAGPAAPPQTQSGTRETTQAPLPNSVQPYSGVNQTPASPGNNTIRTQDTALLANAGAPSNNSAPSTPSMAPVVIPPPNLPPKPPGGGTSGGGNT